MKHFFCFFISIFFAVSAIANTNLFALISDKDGFVNVREFPILQSKVESTIKNGEVVLCTSIDDSPQFCLVNFNNDG